MWEPVGPLPVSVYRRRRATATAGIALVLVVLGFGLSGGSQDEQPAEPVTEVAGPEQPVAAPPPVVEAAECTKEMIAVGAEVDPAEHKVGQQATLRLVVTNIGAQPCTRDLDPARQEIMVVSDDLKSRVWSSNDCDNPSAADRRTLQPNQPLGFRVPWTGRTTNPGCTEKRTVVPEGTYKVVTRLDDVYSEPVGLRRLP